MLKKMKYPQFPHYEIESFDNIKKAEKWLNDKSCEYPSTRVVQQVVSTQSGVLTITIVREAKVGE